LPAPLDGCPPGTAPRPQASCRCRSTPVANTSDKQQGKRSDATLHKQHFADGNRTRSWSSSTFLIAVFAFRQTSASASSVGSSNAGSSARSAIGDSFGGSFWIRTLPSRRLSAYTSSVPSSKYIRTFVNLGGHTSPENVTRLYAGTCSPLIRKEPVCNPAEHERCDPSRLQEHFALSGAHHAEMPRDVRWLVKL
jgi:hypothetical protein